MALSPGARIGHYEVLGPLGSGGMGEVYRATDPRLRREVAIKVLPASFVTDADRLRRFEQEALATASLNHPNILTVFDVGRFRPDQLGPDQGSEVAYVVAELLEGRTLREALGEGPLPIRKAIDVAIQIANGLAAAHAKGIVHRDLKPENVFVTTDERAKILDFGLAKVGDAASAAASTVIGGGTEPGTVMGTIGYMAPEQVRGAAVDHRADIFSFGAVLYEMLSGRRAFGGESAADAMSAILKETPLQLSASGLSIPPALERVVLRCLEKNPAARFQSASDLAFALGFDSSPSIGSSPAAASAAASSAAAAAKPRAGLVLAAATVASLVVGGAAGWWVRPQPVPVDLPVRQFTIPTPNQSRATLAAMAPDGSSVAFATAGKAWVVRFDTGKAVEIAGADNIRALFWSPDSSHIGYQTRSHLWRIPAAGGIPVDLGAVARDFSAAGGATWLPNDRIWYTSGGGGLMEVSAQGGSSRTVLQIDPAVEFDVHDAYALPGNKGVLFIPHPTKGPSRGIDVFDGTTRRQLHRAAAAVRHPAYSPTGHLLYASGSGVWAVRFDLETMTTSGEPILVAPDTARPSVSADGTLALIPEGGITDLQLTWVEGTRVVGTLGRGGVPWRAPRLSPDGRHVVANFAFGQEIDLFIFDVARGTDRRLTFENGADTFGAWSSDSQYIVYECANAVCARRADGSGERVMLVPAPARQPVLSPDDKYLLFDYEQDGDNSTDIMIVPLGPRGLMAPPTEKPRLFVGGRARQGPVDISPDGKFAAYESLEAGEGDVYLTTFPEAKGKWQISRSGGGTPRWSRSGDRVFFNSADRIFAVPIARGPIPEPGAPVEVVNGPGLGARITAVGSSFERSLDGKTFLIPRASSVIADIGFVRVIEQWQKTLR